MISTDLIAAVRDARVRRAEAEAARDELWEAFDAAKEATK